MFCHLKKLIGLILFVITVPVGAQNYPIKPITLVVPFAPGGGTDSIARDLGKLLSEKLGQPVIVDNKGGGGGSIGANAVAKANPDGYTLLLATSTFATNSAIEESLPFNPEKDFTPIAMIGRGPILIVASKQSGIKTLDQLIAQAKKSQSINYCSAGNGSINHLSAELFKQKTGTSMTHIPYKGSGPATIDLIAGRTQVFFSTVPTILSHINANSVELIAVTGSKRLPLFPQTPSTSEFGLKGLDISTWWGILAPANTPKDIVVKLNQAINEASNKDAVKNRLLNEGATITTGTPAEFQNNLNQELLVWRNLVKTAGLKGS